MPSDHRIISRPNLFHAICPLLLAIASSACWNAWTARVCASNASGNCRGTDVKTRQYTVKSETFAGVHGASDAKVRVQECENGIGEVDVTVVDRDDLRVTVQCLTDTSHGPGSMTLPASTAQPISPPTNGGH